MMGWVIFKIESLEVALTYYQKLFAFNFSSIQWQSEKEFYFVLIVAVFFAFFNLIPKFGKAIYQQIFYTSYSNQLHIIMTALSIFLFVLCLASLAGSGFNPFIYFRF